MTTSLRILHLEDNELDAELVAATLEREGFTPDVARVETRDGFVRALEGGGFDIILADYSLPSFDGMSALAIAREMCPDVPYILLSGRMGEDIAVEALKEGATDYVLKTGLSRLAPSVRRALKEAVERAEHRRADDNVRRLNRVYAVLSSVNRLIVRARDMRELFEGSCRIAVEEGLFLMAWVGVIDDAERKVVPVACSGCDAGYLKDINISIDEVPEGLGPTGAAVRAGRSFINNDTAQNPRMAPWRDEALRRGYHSSASFPLMFEGKPVGVFTVYAAEAGFFDEEEVRLLDELAADISYSWWSIEQSSRRAQAEEEARDLNDKLHSLVERAQVGIFIMQEGRYIFCNNRMAEMSGYTREELLGLPDALLTAHPDDRERVREVTLARKGDGTLRYEHRLQCKDGSHLFVESLGSYSLFKGVPSFIGTLIDISEKKELEQQKNGFYAMVTHDLRTPLTAILAYSELILYNYPDETTDNVKEMVASIMESGDRLTSLVDSFLAISKIESGQLTVKPSYTDAGEVLKKLESEFRPLADAKGLSLVVINPAIK